MAEALEIWRGPAFSEVRDEPFARAEARRLEELRLAATESRIDAELTVGRHQGLIGELASLTSAHPMRERLWSQRMLALYRSGRQAEALRVFQDLRTILVAELGIDPGHDITWLEHAILAQDPALDFPAPPEREPGDVAAPVVTASAGYRVHVPASTNEGPLVGRRRESALLRDWWGTVQGGHGRLLLVDGEAGIGKTRLVAELARAVEEDGALVLWGRCDEGPVTPFQAFAEALGRYFQSLSADRISQMPDWQLTELSRLVLRLREHAPLLEEEAGDPETERYRFFEAVATTLLDLSSGATVLLVVDDLHWADQPTLLLLRHVLRSVDATRLGIIGMYNDTEIPPDHPLRSMLADFRAVVPVETVHLQGLSPDAVAELARGWETAPPDLVPELCRLTDGNPLFLDEMLRQLRDRDDDQPGGRDALVPPDLDPPEAIRELVARRVSRLPEDVIYLLQAAAVAGRECDAGIVADAAELTPGQRLDAFDRAEESRLLRRVGEGVRDRYAFTHALVRDAIYGELLRGRRVRYHHKIAVATERAHADALDTYVNELAYHYFMGAALADADKAIHFCMAAGERALRLLAFEEAVGHFTRSLEVAEQSGSHDRAVRCDALIALAEAHTRAGESAQADVTSERAASLARALGDPERLATAALRSGPLSELGVGGPNEQQQQLLEEARAKLPEEDSHLRAMVTARLGLVGVYTTGVPAPGLRERSLDLNTEAVAMARRLADRSALGYALHARLHELWGIEPAPERLATANELGEIAADVGDEFLALQGYMWRIRELLAQGDLDAVNDEIGRYATRAAGPIHPLDAAYGYNVAAMMALIAGDIAEQEGLGRKALEVAQPHNKLAHGFFAAQMIWTWWQTRRARPPGLRHPGGDRAEPVGLAQRARGARTGPCGGGCDGGGTRPVALPRGHRLGQRGRAQRERHPGPGRRRLRRARDPGPRHRPAHLRGDAAVCGHRRGDPPARRRLPRTGRLLPRPSRHDLGRPGAVAGALRSGLAPGPPDALGAVRRRGGGGTGPRAAEAPPWGRRGARGRPPAERRGVGTPPWAATPGAAGGRPGLTPRVSPWCRASPRRAPRPARRRRRAGRRPPGCGGSCR